LRVKGQGSRVKVKVGCSLQLVFHSSWSSRRDQIKVALEYLTSPELADKEVQIIVETQLLLTPYLKGREKMHLLSVTSAPSNFPFSTVQLVVLDNNILLVVVLVISLAKLHSITFLSPIFSVRCALTLSSDPKP
jgi:hypothetical protein